MADIRKLSTEKGVCERETDKQIDKERERDTHRQRHRERVRIDIFKRERKETILRDNE